MRQIACRLRVCSREIDSAAARVEVQVDPSRRAAFANSESLADWSTPGVFAFHADCWGRLRTEVRGGAAAEKGLVDEAARTLERFDAAGEVAAKATRAADIMRRGSRTVCFTGAGLSTAAGLGDYRGKDGKWTREAWSVSGPEKEYTTEYEALRPTFAHECISKLVTDGAIGYVVSQNADGLHHLSGVPYDKLSDVHGSAFTEVCESCSARLVRNHFVPEDRAEAFLSGKDSGPLPHVERCRGCGSNHITGRKCESCGGRLRDTIVSFGDGLESCVLQPAFEFAASADACLSLGSTMSIGPSNQVVTMQGGPLIACVRQETEMDRHCANSGGVRAFGDCNDFMRELMRAYYGEDELRRWEQSLEAKKEVYAELRPNVGKQRGDVFVKKF